MKTKIMNPKVLEPDPSQPLLLQAFLEITAPWRKVFAQQRTFARALRQAIGGLVCLGRRTLTRILWTNGKEQQPWAADYLLHSRAQWSEQSLFMNIVKQALPFCSGAVVGVAIDDTRLHKTGRCIKQAFYQRDPLSPAFHVNLLYGLRFLQSSLLIGSHRKSARFREEKDTLGVGQAQLWNPVSVPPSRHRHNLGKHGLTTRIARQVPRPGKSRSRPGSDDSAAWTPVAARSGARASRR